VSRKTLETLGISVRRKRGERRLREVARDIGISPATLMRIEEGRIPDLQTFVRVCRWMQADPAEYLGLPRQTRVEQPLSVHFKVDRALAPRTAEALAQMVMLAAAQQAEPVEKPPDVDS